MKRISVTDEWLYQYMPIVDEALIRELEDNTDYEYQFSSRFERRMKKLISREAHPWKNALYRFSKKAALLFVCVISSLFVIAMSVQAYRIKLFETVRSIWEDSVFYSYFTVQQPMAFQCYEPYDIPQGYCETDRTVSEHLLSITYMSEDGRMITWDQMLVQDGGKFITDIEYDQQIVEEVNGKTVIIFIYADGFVNAYCECDKYVFILTAENLSVDGVCMMFGCIPLEQ